VRRAVFLDRDGVLVRAKVRENRVCGPLKLADFDLFPGILEPLQTLKNAGFLLIVATNQPSISRGELTRDTLENMHRRLREALPLDDIAVCPHSDEDGCECRKPKPGLLLEAMRAHEIDRSQSYFVGDTGRDLEAGRRAGVRFILLDRDYNRHESAEIRVRDLAEAAALILSGANPDRAKMAG
jgi:D-glycero-D-manno-heptose 1,7-bisphosphate phosphatase